MQSLILAEVQYANIEINDTTNQVVTFVNVPGGVLAKIFLNLK